MKKLISLLLSLVMVLSMGVTAFAAEATTTETVTYGDTTYTVTTSAGVRTVTDNNTGITATYNLSNGMLLLEDSNTEETVTINVGDLMQEGMVAPAASNSSDDNEYAYEYSLKTYNGKQYNFWEIQIPDEIKMTYVNVNNQTYLTDFRVNVDNMREAQDSILGGWGRTILAVIMGIVAATPVGAVATAILAIAGTLIGGDSIFDLIGYSETIATCKENCEDAFDAVIVYTTPSA